MASIQFHKPVEESTVVYRKTVITESSNNKLNNDHSFANKMKEMANSATKLFHQAPNGEGAGGHHQMQQSGSGTRISSNTPHATNATHMHNMQEKKKKENMMTSCTGKKKKQLHENVTFNGTGRKEEKHGGGFLANMEGQVKNFTHKVEGKSKGKGKSKSIGHDSSSDSSDDDCRSKKK